MWELRLCSSGKLCHIGWHIDTNVLKVPVQYKTMWHHISEDHNLNIHCWEKLKSGCEKFVLGRNFS